MATLTETLTGSGETETTEETSSKTTDTTNKSMIDKITNFLQTPLGMGMAAGIAITVFLLWRVF